MWYRSALSLDNMAWQRGQHSEEELEVDLLPVRKTRKMFFRENKVESRHLLVIVIDNKTIDKQKQSSESRFSKSHSNSLDKNSFSIGSEKIIKGVIKMSGKVVHMFFIF